jgi:hypothetical protein
MQIIWNLLSNFDYNTQVMLEFGYCSFCDSRVIPLKLSKVHFWFPGLNFSFPLPRAIKFFHNVFFYHNAQRNLEFSEYFSLL